MKRFILFLIVFTIVASSFILPVSAADYFVPFSSFPYAEALPYGSGTFILEVKYSQSSTQIYWYRFYLPSGSYCILYKQGKHGSYPGVCVAVARPEPVDATVYYQYYTINPSTGAYTFISDPMVNSWQEDAGYYDINLSSSITNSTFVAYTSAPVLFIDNNTTFRSTIKQYPSAAMEMATQVVNAIDNAASQVSDEISNAGSAINSELSRNHDEIMNAGSDVPTLDTDNNWMNDSLTKVNSWLDDLSDFEQQMSRNRVDNAQNMSKAGNFLSDFFGGLPAAVIAAMALCLVIIVVIKIVGR